MDKLELFIFLLIYVTVITFATACFSPALNQNTVAIMDESGVKDSGALSDNPMGAGPGFFGAILAFVTAIFQVLTFSIPFVPAWVGIILCIPAYVFLFVLIDLLIDVFNALSAFLDAVLPDWL
jgi:hypothetical protein